jgi:hypothetical protein
VTIFEHEKEILNDLSVNYYKEEIINNEGETKYIQIKPPIDLKNENILKNNNNNTNGKTTRIGISKMAFSSDNYFLATKNDKIPNILFIWDLNQMNLQFVLIQLNEVVYFEWAKNENVLFISTNNNKLYYFTLDSCKILQLSKDFNNNALIFSPDGKKMMIKDTNNFIMVNLINNNEEEENEESLRQNEYNNMKMEENYINNEKEGNVDNNLKENEIENNNEEEENEEMDEQIKESSEENKMNINNINNNIAFEEEIGMNPDS